MMSLVKYLYLLCFSGCIKDFQLRSASTLHHGGTNFEPKVTAAVIVHHHHKHCSKGAKTKYGTSSCNLPLALNYMQKVDRFVVNAQI